jgi:hypothetical protein
VSTELTHQKIIVKKLLAALLLRGVQLLNRGARYIIDGNNALVEDKKSEFQIDNALLEIWSDRTYFKRILEFTTKIRILVKSLEVQVKENFPQTIVKRAFEIS